MWAMPTSILALTYWLHLAATIVWLGGLATLPLIVWPGLTRTPGDETHQTLLDDIERRFWPLANVSLVVLIITGTLQMGDDPHYSGLFKIDSPWAIGMLAKHIVIAGIVVASIALQWSVQPALDRAALLARRGDTQGKDEEAGLRQQARRLILLSLALGVLVLAFTAFITAL